MLRNFSGLQTGVVSNNVGADRRRYSKSAIRSYIEFDGVKPTVCGSQPFVLWFQRRWR